MLEGWLPAQTKANPDLTLQEHCELFEDSEGIGVSTATMSRAFSRLGLPLKKSSSRPQSATNRDAGSGAKR
jgi:transposase